MGRGGFYIAADPALYIDSRFASGLAVINTEASRVIARTPSTDAGAVLAVYRANPRGLDCSAYVVRRSVSMPLAVVVSAPHQTLHQRLSALPWAWLLGGMAAWRRLAFAGWAAYLIVWRLSPRGQLSDAVRRHQFIVAYQPIVDLATRRDAASARKCWCAGSASRPHRAARLFHPARGASRVDSGDHRSGARHGAARTRRVSQALRRLLRVGESLRARSHHASFPRCARSGDRARRRAAAPDPHRGDRAQLSRCRCRQGSHQRLPRGGPRGVSRRLRHRLFEPVASAEFPRGWP